MVDTLREIRCPVCQKNMKKVFDPKKGFCIDICVEGCGGIFFDNREYKEYDESHEDAQVIFNEFIDKKYEPVDETVPRYCPSCGAKMVKNFSSVKLEIQVDECYSCGGKFLDNGELEKIRAEYLNDQARTDDFNRRLYAIVGIEYENAILENKEWVEDFKRQQRQTLMNRIFGFGKKFFTFRFWD